jgi:hypothetical protein
MKRAVGKFTDGVPLKKLLSVLAHVPTTALPGLLRVRRTGESADDHRDCGTENRVSGGMHGWLSCCVRSPTVVPITSAAGATYTRDNEVRRSFGQQKCAI